jgi:hypothetical protein
VTIRFAHHRWVSPFVHLSNNWISLLGVVLTTTGGVSWLFVLPVQFGEAASHPYLGILFYLLLPAIFFLGLGLIPLGIYFQMRRERRRGLYPSDWPDVNWSNPAFRRLVTFIGIATVLNVLIGGQLTYASVEYVDSVSFCGQACHTVMKPEFTAYQDSPHFRVNCTECHIGAGASWFVRSKLSGVRQVFAVALNTYSRPIEAPVHDLRPARETCEACHWPAKFTGYRLRVLDKFAPDEANTQSNTILMMRIGGGRMTIGIHGFHLNEGVQVMYASDRSRQTIPWVRYVDSSGQATEYVTEDWKSSDQSALETRTMDCIDCHNRPAHTFEPPDSALNEALAGGRLDRSLPFLKQQGLEILRQEYETTAQAEVKIPQALAHYYESVRPEIFAAKREVIEQAGRALLEIHSRNVFPEMKITWGTYPNNIGHTESPGCFRCHDDLHASADGRTIKQDCSSCHELLAIEEANPEVLQKLGIGE